MLSKVSFLATCGTTNFNAHQRVPVFANEMEEAHPRYSQSSDSAQQIMHLTVHMQKQHATLSCFDYSGFHAWGFPSVLLCVQSTNHQWMNEYVCYVQELEKKFQQTAAYRNMKEILTKKNEQIKEIRKRLQRWLYGDRLENICQWCKTPEWYLFCCLLFQIWAQRMSLAPRTAALNRCLQGKDRTKIDDYGLHKKTKNHQFHCCERREREIEKSTSRRNCLFMLYLASLVVLGFSKEQERRGWLHTQLNTQTK